MTALIVSRFKRALSYSSAPGNPIGSRTSRQTSPLGCSSMALLAEKVPPTINPRMEPTRLLSVRSCHRGAAHSEALGTLKRGTSCRCRPSRSPANCRWAFTAPLSTRSANVSDPGLLSAGVCASGIRLFGQDERSAPVDYCAAAIEATISGSSHTPPTSRLMPNPEHRTANPAPNVNTNREPRSPEA